MILQSSAVALSTTGAVTTNVIAAVTGKRIAVYSLVLVYHSGTAPVITILDGTTALTGAMDFPATVGLGFQFDIQPAAEAPPWFITSAGNAFAISTAAPANINGYVQYTIL